MIQWFKRFGFRRARHTRSVNRRTRGGLACGARRGGVYTHEGLEALEQRTLLSGAPLLDTDPFDAVLGGAAVGVFVEQGVAGSSSPAVAQPRQLKVARGGAGGESASDGGGGFRFVGISDGAVGFNNTELATLLAEQVTTTNSDIPIYAPTDMVIPAGEIGIQSNVSGPLIRIDDFRVDNRFTGIDGSGFATVIMDTGIDLDDPFFGADANSDGVSDRIVYTQDFTGSGGAGDVQGHGSNVSSIVASSDSTYTGMAPGADIIHLKVLGDNGSGSFGWLESALQWVVNNAVTYNIASVNLSLGDDGNFGTTKALYGVSDEFAALAAMDVLVVAAAGNDFFTHSSVPGVSYPAADANTLTVGAVYDSNVGGTWTYASGAKAFTTGADHITPFSQRHATLVDTFAPGAPITGAGPGAGLVTMHGTSQASPHVAGVAVLAQQLAVQEIGRRLTLAEFRTLLDDTGVTVNDGDDENDNVTNTGLDFSRIDVVALAEGILAMAPDAPEIKVTDDQGVEVADGSGSVDFGSTIVGEAVTHTFTVTNTGASELTLDSGSFSVPSGFSLSSNFGSTTLAANASTTFTVQLDASSAGTPSGTLSFTNNDANESTYNFTISGTVTAQVIVDNADAGFGVVGTWNTATHTGRGGSYRPTAKGNGSRVATWTFSDLTAGQYRVSTTYPPASNGATDAPFTIKDGATAIVTVDMNMTQTPDDRVVSDSNWEDIATVTLTGTTMVVELSNDANNAVMADAVMIERIGDIPAGSEIEVSLADGTDVADGSGSVDFGSTDLATPVTQSFTVTNVGSSSLTLSSGSFSLPSGFSLSSNFGSTSLALGESTTFVVQLDGSSPGSPSGTVSFTNNDADEGTFNFTVSGVVSAQLIVDNTDAGFGVVGVWGTATHTGHDGGFRPTAKGDGSRVATWTFSDLTAGQYRVSTTYPPAGNGATDAPFTIKDGAATITTVDMDMTQAPDDRTVSDSNWEDIATVTLTGTTMVVELSNDANNTVMADAVMIERIGDIPAGSEIEVMLADGTVVADGSGSVDFGSTDLATPVTQTFTVTNVGGSSLTLSSGSFSLPSGFSLSSNFGSTSLALGESTTFEVQLDGSSPGSPSGTVSFTNNDADEGTFNFTVSGTVGAQLIIDNSDAGFGVVGAWNTATHTGRGGSFRPTAKGDGSRVATWTFNNLSAGQYLVSGTWPAAGNGATDAPFTIKDGATTITTVDMDMTQAPNDRTVSNSNWEDITTVTITGTSLVVELSNDANNAVMADAVMIERVGDIPAGAEIEVLRADGAVLADGSGSVAFGSTGLGTPVTRAFTVINVGGSTLTLSSGSFSLPSGFSLSSNFGSTSLALGASTTFVVQLDGSAPGTPSGTVSFTNNDADEGTFNFTVSGTVGSQYIIDNTDAGFGVVGAWNTATHTGRGGSYRPTAKGNGSRVATWTFTGLAAGQYRVSTTYPPASNGATDAPFTIKDGAAPLTTVDIDMTQAPNDRTVSNSNWEDIDTVTITGSTLVVELSNDANNTVMADAVFIERV